MPEPLEFVPPVVGTYADGRVERFEAGRNRRGDNAWIRAYRSPDLRIVCTSYGVPRLFGIVLHVNGRQMVKLAQARTHFEDSAALYSVPMDGAWGADAVGLCPCGHAHDVDLGKIRAAADRLQGSPQKRRVVDLSACLLD